MGSPADVDELDVAGCERIFRRRGLPLLIADRTVGRDVFGRAAPFLLFVLLVELAGAVELGWPTWVNALAVVGGAVVVGGAYCVLNLFRGRPWHTLPQSVDAPELTFFVLVPALVPVIFGGDWRMGGAIVGVNSMLLGLVLLTVSSGVLGTLWWGLAGLADELATSLMRLVRLLPLLLVFSLVLFYTTEIWQVFDLTHGTADLIIGGFFAVLIVGLVAFHARREARVAVREAAAAVPGSDHPALTGRQLANVAAMIATTQLLQVLVVSLATGLFFGALGLLTVTPEVRELWAISGGSWSVTIHLDDAQLVLDQTLVRVSVALATFTGLYYAINAQVDAVYRSELMEGIAGQLREVFTVRRRYLGLLADAGRSA